jgi:hypothetical protein
MIETVAVTLLGATATALFSAIGILIAMRIRLAVLEEKIKYQSGQIRMLLRRAKMLGDGDEG